MSVFIVDKDGIEAKGSPNISVNFFQTAQCHMPVVPVYNRCLNGNSLTLIFSQCV